MNLGQPMNDLFSRAQVWVVVRTVRDTEQRLFAYAGVLGDA